VNDTDVYVPCLFLALHATAGAHYEDIQGKLRSGSTHSQPLHYVEVCGELDRPAAVSPRNEPPVPFEYVALWAPRPVWAFWKIEKPRFKQAPPGHRTKRSPRLLAI
jgi:hypothetical protein